MSTELAKAPAQEQPKAEASAQVSATETKVEAQSAQVEAAPASKEVADKTQESKNPAEGQTVVPEKYDLKLKEGSLLDAAYVEKVTAYAKEHKLSNEQAQAHLDRETGAVAAYMEGATQKLKHQADVEWPAMAKADPEIGGEAFNKNVEISHRVLAKYGSPKLMEELNNTGFGNHPELIRVFSKIGKMMTEDQLVMPGAVQGSGQKSMADVFYGSTTNK